MAKPLVFQLAGTEIPLHMEKIDRSKLYGYVDIETLDEEDRPCELATLAGDGQTLIGKGGTAIGYLSPDGTWSDKASLKPVNVEGNEIQPVGSSFNAPVRLEQTATVDEYLSHNIRATYMLAGEGVDAIRARLQDGTIFKFDFSFRGGLQADAAFLVLSADEQVFLCLGSPTSFEFVGLQQVAPVVSDEETEEEEDDMDFGMM